MNIDVVISQQDIEYFILILVRITSFVFLAPFFGMSNTPSQTKLGLSIFLSITVLYILSISLLNLSKNSFSEIMKLSEFSLNEAKRNGKNKSYLYDEKDYFKFLKQI